MSPSFVPVLRGKCCARRLGSAEPRAETSDMESEGGEEVSVAPCNGSGTGTTAASTDRDAGKKANRQQTVSEMFAGKAHPPKRQRALSDSPGDGGQRTVGVTSRPGVTSEIVAGLSSESLSEIQKLIEAATLTIVTSFQQKFESLERRSEVLEGELHEQSLKIQELEKELLTVKTENDQLYAQVESMDINRRMNTLILKCGEFGRPEKNENIEEKVIKIITERFPDVRLAGGDFQTCHRLQTDDTVICKFLRTQVRDRIYDKRIELAKAAGRDSRAALFINESLTARNRQLFGMLLEAKRNGKVCSVFTRKGVPFYKTAPGGRNFRLDSADQLRELRRPVGGAPAAAAPPAPTGGPRGGRGDRRDRRGRGADAARRGWSVNVDDGQDRGPDVTVSGSTDRRGGSGDLRDECVGPQNQLGVDQTAGGGRSGGRLPVER